MFHNCLEVVSQMAYSINPVLHNYANKKGLCKVYIQIIFNRFIVRVNTHYHLNVNQFKDGLVINHPSKQSINSNLRNQVNDIESKLINYLRSGMPDKSQLQKIVSNSINEISETKFTDFIKSYMLEMDGKRSVLTNKGYTGLIPDLDKFDPVLTLNKIDETWLNLYEKHQRSLGWEGNTIHKKMCRIKTLLYRAADRNLTEENKFKKYCVPVYIQNIPEYISEEEMKAIKDLVDNIKKPVYKMAGYYFLLACYAGYRLGDLKKFDHDRYVKGDKIILRARKNKAIIMMPLHSRLAEILTYVKQTPCDIAEQHLRDYVKEIVKLAGINRHIKIHTARHSFAMMLMDNGFDLEEVAALLGVSLKTAAIYGHISNKRLENKVRSKLG